ncbi:MAG: chaperone NapD [Thiotrichales bacterium]|jgi:nitrate reductase NapAB chaperone NapD|nr:chaperone NapD [Thiotrichales bacterium]MBT3613930.1 chaperone NapD [Thiotrichales bacterium]MBT3752206.1 chaperone NapD [Thiotrichales bacterium]MBT3836870.1 chaperone NapD [Thiotrichales bacterium]MBT4151776.1 chaperone NapD [Thiotrichales bacterium]
MTEELIQISGIAIRFTPEFMQPIKEKLLTITGLEIHAEDPAGKFAVTIENRNSHAMTDIISDIEALDGVVLVNPVYIHDEEEMSGDNANIKL